MKRIILLLSATLMIAATSVSAQTRFGILVGANYTSNPTSFDDIKTKAHGGFNIGAIVDYQLPVFGLGVNSGLILTSNSIKVIKKENNEEMDKNFKINYLKIPLNARMKFGLGILPAIDFAVIGGAYASVNIGDNNNSIKDFIDKDLRSKRITYGLNGGVGLELFNRFRINALYTMPLSNDYKFKDVGTSTKDFIEAKNKTFSLSAVVLF